MSQHVAVDRESSNDMSQRLSERLIGRHLRRAWGVVDQRLQRFRHIKALRLQITEVGNAIAALDKVERRRLVDLMQVTKTEDRPQERRGRANYEPSDDSYVALRKSGYARMQSSSLDARMNGLAMWLRGANRETTQSQDPNVLELAPLVEKLLREVVKK